MTDTAAKGWGIGRRWRKLSIRVKLLTPVLVATLIAFAILAARVPPPINALVESNARNNFSVRLGELRAPLAGFLSQAQEDLLAVAASPDVQSMLDAQASGDKDEIAAAQAGLSSTLVGKITEGQLPYSEIRYLDTTGRQLTRATARLIGDAISGSVVPANNLVSEAISGYWADLQKLAQGDTYLLPVTMSNPDAESGLTPEPVIEIAAPVFNQSQLVGVLIGDFRIRDFLTQTFRQLGKQVSYRSILADQGGQVIAVSEPTGTANDPGRVVVFGDDAASRLAVTLPVRQLDGTGDFQAIQDRVYVSESLSTLSAVPENHWLLIVGDALNTVYAGARDLEVTLFITLGVVFLIAMGGIAAVSQSVTRPLVEASQAADRVSAGDLEAKAPVRTQDEVGMMAVALNTMSSRLSELIRTLESRVQERTRNIELAAEVSRNVTQLTSLNDLLQRTVNEVKDRFGLYHAQIFLADETKEYARLVVATGEAGAELLAAGHKILIGSESIVGQAMAKGHLVVTLDTEQSTTAHLFNRSLPLTRSELAVPLRVGGETIGVLDIHSTQSKAFTSEDEKTFQMIANQLSVAVDNVRLFEKSQEARQIADEANRQKSEFLSNMSHELRTPLNVIIGYSHSILTRPAMYDNVPLPPVYVSAIESIRVSGQVLLGLISDILDLSKIEAGRIELDIKPTNVLPILEGIRSTALGLIKPGVQVRADYPGKLPNVLADELRLRQILLNLVSNAAKFTTRGFITINAVVQDGNLLFSVSDTGPGIPDDMRPLIFERFQQGSSVASKYGGTGLGLSISRQLTKLQGGDIWFKTEVGQGATFYFTVPLAPVVEEAAQPAAVAVPEPDTVVGTSRAHIFVSDEEARASQIRQALVVDTDSESRASLETALGEAGFSVLSADDHERALSIATILTPDVIVIHLHPHDSESTIRLPVVLRTDENLAASQIVVIEPTQELASGGEGTTKEKLRDLVLEKLKARL